MHQYLFIAVVFLNAATAAAQEVTDIHVSSGLEQTLEGSISGEEIKILSIHSAVASSLTVTISGTRRFCSVDVSSDSRPISIEYRDFPAIVSVRSNGLDPIRLSVLRTRVAILNKATCNYKVIVR